MYTDKQARLAACDLVRTRFPGRAEMRRAATTDPVALATLEAMLGLASQADLARATRDYLRVALGMPGATSGQLRGAAIRAGLSVAGVAVIRAARTAARQTGDPIAGREPGHALSEHARRTAEALIRCAGFRTATHAHTWSVDVVEPGEEGASSVSGSMWASDAGLGRAYAARGFRVATSIHRWRVSPAILRPDVRGASGSGVIYLRPDLRIVQGRGTSLVTERLIPGATGRIAWRRA